MELPSVRRGQRLCELRERLGAFSAAELSQRFEQVGLPFAPITDPQHLLKHFA